MKKQIMTLALLGLLAGCSSALTALHYYSLDAEALPAAAGTERTQRHKYRSALLARRLKTSQAE